VFRRPEIAMSPEELRAFLDEERTVTCASIGPNGRPHLMPLWYAREGDEILCWTYGNSQKVKNLERLPQATLQVEAGEKYEELRGAMLECDVEIVRDRERIVDIGVTLTYRYGSVPPGTPDESIRARAVQRGTKRVGLRFRPTRIVSWDHRKLGGSY
jgi:PPOX class probable F420-dependent enzyme